ncbi:hypothetical protein CCAX7_65720 [Capsulimonas corticalis]|uniref:Uncharacterized protein n=1 Tax=Capsulimonas corticalis TaxID=2219043 RepID=A0A402CR45_9BACT|nr:hypothetical protein CCAX7_65720 [Capsulimonas corticalis]
MRFKYPICPRAAFACPLVRKAIPGLRPPLQGKPTPALRATPPADGKGE